MHALAPTIVLRPRFRLEIPDTGENVLRDFENSTRKPFLVNRMDNHILITFNPENTHIWSPQLQLEIEGLGPEKSRLYGVFGPSPALWTFFMFLHFGLATLFIILGILAYSTAALQRPVGIPLGLMALTVILWFALYLLGRAGRNRGKSQMNELHRFFLDVLKR